MFARSDLALVAALVAVAASLQGCALMGGGPTCPDLKVNDDLTISGGGAEGAEGSHVCSEGLEYKGPKLTCNWVGKQCEKKDKTKCGKLLAWGKDGDGLKKFPKDGKVTLVDHVSSSFLGTLKAKAHAAAAKAKDMASKAKDKVKDLASKAKDKAKDLAAKAKGEAKKVEGEAKKVEGEAKKEAEKAAGDAKKERRLDGKVGTCVKKAKEAAKKPEKEEAKKPEEKEEAKKTEEKKFKLGSVAWESGSVGSVFLGTFAAVMAVGGMVLLAIKLNRRRNLAQPAHSADYDMEDLDEAIE